MAIKGPSSNRPKIEITDWSLNPERTRITGRIFGHGSIDDGMNVVLRVFNVLHYGAYQIGRTTEYTFIIFREKEKNYGLGPT